MPSYIPSAKTNAKTKADINATPPRDAGLACGMSILLPGLGQLYNRERRKAIFFLAVGCINYLLLLVLLASPQILQTLKVFGAANQVRLNQALATSLTQMQLGSAACFALISLFVGFSIFAARDAYDRAQYLKRGAIYRDYFVGMPEATSGSYIFHISLLMSAFILAFFFLIPAQPQAQITDIEFKQTEENTKEVQKTKNHAENNSRAGGRRDHSRPSAVAAASSSSSSSRSSSSARQAQSKPVTPPPQLAQSRPEQSKPEQSKSAQSRPAIPQPTPQPSLQRVAQNFLQPKPVVAPPTPAVPPNFIPSQNLRASNSTPLPAVPTLLASALPALNAPKPLLSMPSSTAPSNLNLPKQLAPSSASSGEVKIASAAGLTSSSNSSPSGSVSPLPVGMRSGSGNRTNNKSDSGSPSPSRSTSDGSALRGLGPAVAPSLNNVGNQNGQNKSGKGDFSNPDDGRGRESVGSRKDVDFSAYMAELQRRIKRAWFPPKDARSKRVKVIFKVHHNGEMSNLRLASSSGLTAADEAALKAIETAAPFHTLPEGAPADVDIEFTFDYNVFNGGGSGSYRAF